MPQSTAMSASTTLAIVSASPSQTLPQEPSFILATFVETGSAVTREKHEDRLLFDSGAAIHVCPLRYAEEYKLQPFD